MPAPGNDLRHGFGIRALLRANRYPSKGASMPRKPYGRSSTSGGRFLRRGLLATYGAEAGFGSLYPRPTR